MKIVSFFNKYAEKLNEHGAMMGFPYILFGAYELFNYLFDYGLWYAKGQYDDLPFLRMHLISMFLCLLIVLRHWWPTACKRYFTLFWYITLCWCLPFSATYFILSFPSYSVDLTINIIMVIFTIVLIVDWLSFLITLFCGATIAILVYYIQFCHVYLPSEIRNRLFTDVTWSILVGILFSRNAYIFRRNAQLDKQLSAVKSVVASIAHELRTPLLSIKSGANGIRKLLPKLVTSYKIAEANKLDIPDIHIRDTDKIIRVMENIDSEVNYSNTVIDTLLMNASKNTFNPNVFTKHSMISSIKAALIRYPFNPKSDIELIHLNENNNFYFYGDDLLMVHVIFNLIKNATYAIAEARKGQIFICLERYKNYNKLRFKDTAKGLAPEIEAKLFDAFYSKTPNNTGMGLAYCKLAMESFGGKIHVSSKLHQYTEFILEFPTVPADDKETKARF